MAALTVDIAGKSFAALGRAPRHDVLRGIRLTVEPGATLAVIGPSGCGKTTMLNIVAGLDTDFHGRIDRHQARLAYVFQEPRLLPWRTVRQNVELVLGGAADASARATEALAEVGMTAAAEVYASRLSLGMARRAALARAFSLRPTLLLLDEPFVSLDEPTARRLRLLLLDLLERYRCTAVLVTHHLEEAVILADRLLMLDGQPATVRLDLPVDLAPVDRRDPERVATCRRRLLALQPRMAAAMETAIAAEDVLR